MGDQCKVNNGCTLHATAPLKLDFESNAAERSGAGAAHDSTWKPRVRCVRLVYRALRLE